MGAAKPRPRNRLAGDFAGASDQSAAPAARSLQARKTGSKPEMAAVRPAAKPAAAPRGAKAVGESIPDWALAVGAAIGYGVIFLIYVL